jgi:hypothetical protein
MKVESGKVESGKAETWSAAEQCPAFSEGLVRNLFWRKEIRLNQAESK